MEMTLKQMLGQKLEYGFHGTEMTEAFKNLIREYKIGNVIIFRRSSTTTADTSRSPFSVLNRGRRKNRSGNAW